MGNDQSRHTQRRSAVNNAGGDSVRQSQHAVGSTSTANPGAYTVSNNQRGDQRFYVTIPRGIRPGQHFAVLVNGQQMMVRCPPGNREGDRLVVTAPRQQSHNYVVTVPPNVRPGNFLLKLLCFIYLTYLK